MNTNFRIIYEGFNENVMLKDTLREQGSCSFCVLQVQAMSFSLLYFWFILMENDATNKDKEVDYVSNNNNEGHKDGNKDMQNVS